MDTLTQDIRHGVRVLLKSPGFSLIALLVLALGVGASAAIFSVVNAVLLRPLAYRDADRLVTVWQNFPKESWPYVPFSPPDYLELKSQSSSFEEVAAGYL